MISAPLNCLIIDHMHPSIEPMLHAIGVQADYQPDLKAEDLKAILPQYDGLLVRSKVYISKDIVEKADRLRFIGRAGAGVDNIDVAALEQKGITLLNAPEGNADAVGEFTIGLLLALFRNIAKSDKEVRSYEWQREANRGEEIMGKTIGLIGYGNMGQAFAHRLAGFNCTVLAYDKNTSLVADKYAQLVSLEELAAQAEVLSLHIPYVPENRHLVNEQFINAFQNNIWLLNTARGEIVHQRDLVKLLQQGKIKGAALDVLENEKLKTLNEEQKADFEYLAQAENVILTPHIGGWSHQSYVKINQVLVRKIEAFLKKQ